ncbi:hypothetical protein [Abiotrophia sp.]|nr:hypothetical protein [Abiotrophia sp.]MBF0940980.1 hypothetical protein [Abiotrophia sp.]
MEIKNPIDSGIATQSQWDVDNVVPPKFASAIDKSLLVLVTGATVLT